MSSISKQKLDEQTIHLLDKLGSTDPAVDKLKEYIENNEFDFETIADDVNGPEDDSDIYDVVGSKLFGKLKSLVCCDSINDSNINNSSNIQSRDLSLNENDEEKEPMINHSVFNYNQLPHEQTFGIDNTYVNDSDYDDDEHYVLIQKSNKSNKHMMDKTEEKEDDDNEQNYNENPQMQMLISNLQQLPNKDAVNVLLHFLHEDKYTSIAQIKDDIEDQENSSIFEHIQTNDIDTNFFTTFCEQIYEIERQGSDPTSIEYQNDEWSIILQRMEENIEFDTDIYQQTIDYFREESWTVETYREDAIDEELSYEDSEFHNIFPDMIDSQRKRLIRIFEKAIMNHPTNNNMPTSTARPTTYQQDHTSFNQIYNRPRRLPQHEEKKEEGPRVQDSDDEIEDGNVDDEDHSRYKKIAKILYGCAKMIMQPGQEPKEDKDLKCLCSILDINTVLHLSEILCRQYLLPLYHANEDNMNDLLEAISSEHGAMSAFIGSPSEDRKGFIDNQYGLFKKPHDISKFGIYIKHALEVLKAHRWLGFAQPPILHTEEHTIQYEDDCSDDELDGTEREPPPGKLKCNARDVQIYVFAFLISTTRMLIKNFEDTNNVHIMLDMKFPTDKSYKSEEGTMNGDQLWNQSMKELQSKIIKFAECFENPQIRGIVKDKIRKEHALIIHTVDFDQPIENRFESGRPKAWVLDERGIGFELEEKEYKKSYDKCELFHLLRVKRYAMLTSNASIGTRDRHKTFDHDRISISLHKFGNRLKFYMHFKGGIFRMRMEDLCSWFPKMFKTTENKLEWDNMKRYLARVLRDNQDLVPKTTGLIGSQLNNFFYHRPANNNYPQPERINFWRNIRSWHDLDDDYYRQCDKFTYIMKKKYWQTQFGSKVFDENIVDIERVTQSTKINARDNKQE